MDGIKLIGTIIRQAIVDYRKYENSTTNNRLLYDDAKNFLFTDQLDDFLDYYMVLDKINPDYIREQADMISYSQLKRVNE